jgi:hypothetical protein
MALASDGRSIAFSVEGKLRTDDLGSESLKTIYSPPAGYYVRDPRYVLNGQELVFFVEHSGAGGSAIAYIKPDGSGLEVPVTGLAPYLHEAPDLSPGGSQLVYTAGEANELIVANPDGSEPKAIVTGLEHVEEPRFSPDGTKIAFEGVSSTTKGEGEIEGENQIFTINVDGTNLKQVSYDEFAWTPEWMPGGERVAYTGYKAAAREQIYSAKADGSGEEQLLEEAPAGFEDTRLPAFVSSGGSDDEYLGKTFAPILRFHSGERWRPLNVDRFLTEKDPIEPAKSYNEVCSETFGCRELTSTEFERAGEEEGPRLNLGKWPEWSYPTSPNEGCYTEVFVELWDCDSGPRTAMYYHVIPSANGEEATEAGYNYVDYWLFYRYNHDPGSTDDHQGDWEGLTVAPSTTKANAFDFAIFAQHAYESAYLPGNLECDEGGGGSCGVGEGASAGQRIWDYVAEGTHASYPSSSGELTECAQTEAELPESLLSDGCHDGAAPWGANGEAGDILDLEEESWVEWPGHWGIDDGGLLPVKNSPPSPGNQERFKCPWHEHFKDATACPASARRTPAQARESVASACGSWFGNAVVATVCSPQELRRSVRSARLGRRGHVHIALGDRGGRSAAAPGVAQALGPPLLVGEVLSVSGRAAYDTTLLVRAQGGSRMVEGRFEHLGLVRGGRGQVKAVTGPRGIRLIWIAPDGRTTQPVQVRSHRVVLKSARARSSRGTHSVVMRRIAKLRAPAAAEKQSIDVAARVRGKLCERAASHYRHVHKAHMRQLNLRNSIQSSTDRTLTERLAGLKC